MESRSQFSAENYPNIFFILIFTENSLIYCCKVKNNRANILSAKMLLNILSFVNSYAPHICIYRKFIILKLYMHLYRAELT